MDDYTHPENEEEIMQDDDYQRSVVTNLSWDSDFMDSSNFSSLQKDVELPSTAQSCQTKNQNLQLNLQEESYNEGLFVYEPRKTNKIEVKNKRTRNEYIQAKKGDKKQTKQLSINYKTILTNILDQYQNNKNLTEQQKQIIKQFELSQANLTNFRKLFGIRQQFFMEQGKQTKVNHLYDSQKSDQIRIRCLQQLNSKMQEDGVIEQNCCNKIYINSWQRMCGALKIIQLEA